MITIKNDTGGVLGTKILDDDGADLCRMLAVSSLKVDFKDASAPVMAEITVGMVKTEISAAITKWLAMNPTKEAFEELASMEFRDGTHIKFGSAGIEVYTNDGPPDNPQMTRVSTVSDGRIRTFRK